MIWGFCQLSDGHESASFFSSELNVKVAPRSRSWSILENICRRPSATSTVSIPSSATASGYLVAKSIIVSTYLLSLSELGEGVA